ncbi:MAG TPA: PQQ-dependent sugar dehydrogenase [Solirubrobacteraceae bacterium]
MRRGIPTTLVALLAAAAAGCGAADEPDVTPVQPARESGAAAHFAVTKVASGFDRPTWVGAVPGDDKALWIAEQPGRLTRLAGRDRRTMLDIRDQVKTGSEQGLLGVAFHPDFATNRRLYVHFSDPKGDTRVQELELRGRRPHVTRTLLALDQPEENHNGGQLAFGPDGRLYLGLGDGGGAFDPDQRAQDPDDLLGKLVAFDVDQAAKPRPVVVLTGLRNPWRFSFDLALGEVWIGDVGQDEVEEVNRVLLELDETPKNLGWSAFEGSERVEGHGLGDGDVVWPVAAYSHKDGCSITGGLIYRGARLPKLAGRYVYGDFCSGSLWSLKPTPGKGATDVRRERAKVPQLTHIGADARSELVFASASGAIFAAVKR